LILLLPFDFFSNPSVLPFFFTPLLGFKECGFFPLSQAFRSSPLAFFLNWSRPKTGAKVNATPVIKAFRTVGIQIPPPPPPFGFFFFLALQALESNLEAVLSLPLRFSQNS